MEYNNARTLLVKSFRKLNNRVDNRTYNKIRYLSNKNSILKKLRQMDKILSTFIAIEKSENYINK